MRTIAGRIPRAEALGFILLPFQGRHGGAALPLAGRQVQTAPCYSIAPLLAQKLREARFQKLVGSHGEFALLVQDAEATAVFAQDLDHFAGLDTVDSVWVGDADPGGELAGRYRDIARRAAALLSLRARDHKSAFAGIKVEMN